jgi:chromosome condensin MukBEF complex kleisin-like MukF subunit
MTKPQEFKEQLDKFINKTKELRAIVSSCDRVLHECDTTLALLGIDDFTSEQAWDYLNGRRSTLINRDNAREQLKEYEKIIQRLKSTL